MKPFKLRVDLVQDSQKIFEIAEKHFGQPSSKTCRWQNSRCHSIQEWSVHTNIGHDSISIEHCLGDFNLKINWQHNWFEQPLHTDIHPITQMRMDAFLIEVSKPWSEWTEEEVLENASWILMFSQAEGYVSENMHNAMVMYSYRNPEDEYVKEYFKALPKRKR